MQLVVFVKGITAVEKLLTNHELIIKSWRLDPITNDEQVRDHLVHMRRVFMQRSIVFCKKSNIQKLVEMVNGSHGTNMGLMSRASLRL